MATLNDYFRTETRDFLLSLERSLQRAGGPDASELHRAVRGLRGTAQMAREQRVFDVVSAFESVTRSLAGDALAWSDNIAARARDTITDLRALLDAAEDDEALDARVSGAAARWRETDPDPVTPAASPVADAGTREFREFAAREAAGIADALDHGIQDLQADAMDRAPLMNILRRQRALLGSARLEEIPVIADILRAVEDLTRVIVKLDVGVKQEWLDIYRVARDALQTTIAPLLRDELPQSSNSVSRLRHMRAELLERYGSVDESAQPPVDPFAGRTATVPAAPFMVPARSASSGQGVSAEAAADSSPDAASSPSATGSPAPVTAPARSPSAPFAPRSPAAPFVPPVASTHSPRVAPTWKPVAADMDPGSPVDTAPYASGSQADVLEPEEQVAAEHPAPEHGAADAVDESVLDLAEDAVMDGPVLELGEDAALDGPVFELGEDAALDAPVLELGEDAALDAPVLEPGVDAAVDEYVLELGADAAVDEAVLDLGYADMAPDGDVLELGDESVVEDAAVQESDEDEPMPAAQVDTLARALELRSIIERAAAHDPAARAALDELYSLIRRALG